MIVVTIVVRRSSGANRKRRHAVPRLFSAARFDVMTAGDGRVRDEERVDVGQREIAHFLLHHACRETVAAPDFQRPLGAAQHFRHELVAGEGKRQVARVLKPLLVRMQAEPCNPVLVANADNGLIERVSYGF